MCTLCQTALYNCPKALFPVQLSNREPLKCLDATRRGQLGFGIEKVWSVAVRGDAQLEPSVRELSKSGIEIGFLCYSRHGGESDCQQSSHEGCERSLNQLLILQTQVTSRSRSAMTLLATNLLWFLVLAHGIDLTQNPYVGFSNPSKLIVVCSFYMIIPRPRGFGLNSNAVKSRL